MTALFYLWFNLHPVAFINALLVLSVFYDLANHKILDSTICLLISLIHWRMFSHWSVLVIPVNTGRGIIYMDITCRVLRPSTESSGWTFHSPHPQDSWCICKDTSPFNANTALWNMTVVCYSKRYSKNLVNG